MLLSIYNDCRMWDRIMFPSSYLMGLFCIVLFVLSLLYLSVNKLSKNKDHSILRVLKITYSITVLYLLITMCLILSDILNINPPPWFSVIFAEIISFAFIISNLSLFLYWVYAFLNKKSY